MKQLDSHEKRFNSAVHTGSQVLLRKFNDKNGINAEKIQKTIETLTDNNFILNHKIEDLLILLIQINVKLMFCIVIDYAFTEITIAPSL